MPCINCHGVVQNPSGTHLGWMAVNPSMPNGEINHREWALVDHDANHNRGFFICNKCLLNNWADWQADKVPTHRWWQAIIRQELKDANMIP